MLNDNVTEVFDALTLDEIKDLQHFANTNQISILLINKFTDLGLCNDQGRPTDLANSVASWATEMYVDEA